MKIIELIIDPNEELMGVEAMSVVEHPAIESNFVALNTDAKVELKTVETEEKKLLLGPALIPNKPIYRNDKENGEYYIYFSKKTVQDASQLFLKAGNQAQATVEHEKPVQGLTVVESWIVDDPEMDKSKLYGLSVPKGTWMIATKVENEEVWQMAKEGKVKGYSIEAYFADKYETPQERGVKDDMSAEIIAKIKEILENE